MLMNSPYLERAAKRFADRLQKQVGDDPPAAVTLAYRLALCRPPTKAESAIAESYLNGDLSRLKHFCLLMYNLDEFIYVR